MKTFVAKPHEVQRDWYVIDAKDKVLFFFFASSQDLLKIDRRIVLAEFSFFAAYLDFGSTHRLQNFAREAKVSPANRVFVKQSRHLWSLFIEDFSMKWKKKIVGRMSESFGARAIRANFISRSVRFYGVQSFSCECLFFHFKSSH